MPKPQKSNQMDETKRIMERLVNMPPKPHKPIKDLEGESAKKKGDGPAAKPNRRPRTKSSIED